MNNRKQPIDQSKQVSGHVKLEPRRLLNADFNFGLGSLSLNNFVDSTVGDDLVTVTQTGTTYSFVLSDGIWNGTDGGIVSGSGTNSLDVDNSLSGLLSIVMQSDTVDQFDIRFSDFNFNGDVDITNLAGNPLFGLVDQTGGASFIQTGTLDIDGAEIISLTEAGNDFDLVNIQGATQVDLNDSNGIQFTALESTANSTITAGGTVDLSAVVVAGDLDVSTTLGDIADSGTVEVGGTAQFSATAGSIGLDQLDVTGSIGLDSLNSATIVNTTAIDLLASTIGTDLDVTATLGDITDSGDIDVNGMAQFTATAGSIDLDQLDVTGSIGLDASDSATIVNTTAVDLKLSSVGTDLSVTATLGDLTDSGVVDVNGMAQFNAAAGLINLDQLDVTGSIGLTSLTSSTIVNTTAIDLKASSVGTDLTVTATTGNITDSGVVDVNGMAQFNAAAGLIDLDQLDVTGSIGLTSLTSSTIVNTTAVDLKTSTVGTDLTVTATTGNITDSGVVDVNGMAQFNAAAGLINLDQLDVTGSIGLTSLTSATIVNTTAIDLKASSVGTDLTVTATTGNITDSGVVDVNGMAQFNAAAGLIDLDQLDVTGSIGLTSLTSSTIVNTTAVDLKASTVGTDLTVTATTGNITDSGVVDVNGMAQFNALAGLIDLNQLDVTGSIGLTSATSATIVNTTAVDLKASTVGTDLTGTATTGNITDSGVVDVNGMAQFNAAAGLIDLNQLDVTGSIGLNALTSATIVNTTAVDLKASSVGTDLTVTATTGNITDSGVVDVNGMAQFNAAAGLINLDQLNVTGSIGLTSLTSAMIVNTTAIDLKASTVGTDLTATATTGDLTDSGVIDVNGMAQFNAPAGLIDLDQIDVTGSIGLASLGNATIVNTTVIDFNTSSVGGNLITTPTTGDITQSGAISVGGTSLFAVGTDLVCLTDPGNDFVGVVTASGSTVELVDRNAMTVGTITAVDDIFLRSGATESGLLTLAGNLTTTAVDGQILLQSDSGVNQTITSVITTSELLLGGDLADEGSGAFNLSQANVVDLVAADLAGDLQFTNSNSLVVADLNYASACGTLEAICGLNVGGNLQLDITGGLSQTAAVIVQGTTGITATLEVCLTGGDCTGDGLNDNNFVGEITIAGTTVEIVDANALVVGLITAVDDVFLRSGDNGSGPMTLNGNVTTSSLTGQVLLQSDSGVTQSAASVITTSELILGGNLADEGSGSFNLTSDNVVGAIAADINTLGELRFVNTLPVVVGSLNYSSICGTTEAISGLEVTDKIALTGPGITLNEQVQSAKVFLNSSNGVTQGLTGQILTTELILSGTGLFDLTNPLNDTDRLAAGIVGTLNYADADDVTIAELECDGIIVCGLDITGDLNLTTNNGDLFQALNPATPTLDSAAVIVGGNTVIDTGTGDICLTGGDCTGDGLNDNRFDGTLTIVSTGDVVIAEDDDVTIDSLTPGGSYRFVGNNIQINTAITGNQLLLEASNGVDYNGNVIDVTDLILTGTGIFDFGQSGETQNVIDNLAADINGSLNVLNSVALNIGDLTFISNCGNVQVCGVNIDVGGGQPGSLDLIIVDAALTQSASVSVEGASSLTTGTGDICLTGGDCTGDGLNDNDFVGEVTATGATVEIVDANAMTTGVISAVNDIFLRSGDNGVGALTLNGNLTTSAVDGQILLQSDAGVVQNATSIITTSQLLLGGNLADEGSGNFLLTQANVVANLAVDLEANLAFTNSNALLITELDYVSVCGTTEAICGLTVGGNLILNVTGNLTQTAAVIVQGTTDLTATEEICLTGGDCTGDGLNDNDFVGAVTATATTVEIVDANALTVGVISAVDDIFLRSGDNGVGALTLDGNLTTTAVDGQILLQSDSGAVQNATSVITTNQLLLGGDLADERSGDFLLTQANVVANLAADLEANFALGNSTSLLIAELDYVSICGTTESICGLNIGGNLTLDITGNLTQATAVIVQGTSNLTASEDICLTGGDCTGDGLNDNDFVGEVTATAATVEIVDANALTVGVVTAVDDIFLRSGDNGVGALTLNGNLTTSAANGQILLQSDSGVMQNATSIITTNQLLLGGDLADERSGDFILSQANVIANLAADLEANFTLTNSISWLIADLTYVSDCGTTEAICGLNVGGNLTLATTGSLTQNAAVIVQGTTDLVATGEICLTGGDCTGDGLNDNDFVGEVTAAATTVEIVDANVLTVGLISAVDNIFLRSGDNGVGALTLNGNLTTSAADGQVLLQSDSGVVQSVTSVITSNQLLLGGDLADESSGDFTLTQANVVDLLAADLENNLTFVNTLTLTIADLTYASACGTTEAICGLNIAGDLSLTTNNGDLFQALDPAFPNVDTAAIIVGGNTIIDTGTGNICLTGGDCTGDGLNDNRFDGTLTLIATGDVVIAEDDDISIDAVLGGGSLRFIGNNIQINTAITASQLLLEANNGVDYNGNVIDVTDLILIGTGRFDFGLSGDTLNSIDNLAADIDGALNLINADPIDIGELTFVSDCGNVQVCGVNIDIGGGEPGSLELRIADGDLTQSAAVTVEGATLLATGTGNIWLTGGDCTGDGLNDNDFVGEIFSATGSSVEIVDANDLIVATVSAVDNIFLRSGDNGVGGLTLNGNVTTSAAAGQVLLQSDSGVVQNATSVITTNQLLLGGDLADESTGNFVLDQANTVELLAANLVNDLDFVNATSLVVADLTYLSAVGTTEAICGLNVGGNLTLNITGNLTQAAAVIVQGTSDLTASEDICLTGGDCTGDGLNDNDFVGEVSATGDTVEIVDANALIVGLIDAVDDIFLRSGDNGVGALTLNGNVTTSAANGQILLQSDSGVVQNVTSIITTNELLLGGDLADESSGDFVLQQANVVANLAADLEASLSFTNSNSLLIAELDYVSDCGTTESICGLNVGGNLTLNITGNLTQAAAVIVQGTSDLTASEDICLTAGDCTGDGLNDNDFVGEVSATGDTIEIVDANALNVGLISAVDDIFLRSGDNGVGAMTLNGNLTTSAANGQILLQSDSGVVQKVTSIITTNELLLGGDLADESSGDFILTQANVVANLAADLEASLSFTNSNSLLIAELDYVSDCGTTESICGLNVGGNLTLNITGNLTQAAAVIVQGTSDLTASEDICLTGGDCTGDGLNDNDFIGEVSATGDTVEIVDANALNVGLISAVDDIYLRSGDNGVGAMTLNGNLTTSAANGQILLQSDSGVVQNVTSVITTNQLLLGGDLADESSGDFILTQANVVANLAADLEANLSFSNSNSLLITELDYVSDCGTTESICGLNASGNLTLDVTGSITQTAAVIVQGTSDLTATEEICLTGGDCTGDGLNDNDFVGEVTATATTVEIVDTNGLTVGVVSAVDDVFLRSGDNGVGAMTLNGNLTTSAVDGQILLQSDSGVVQNATSIITTNQLLLGGDLADEGSGDFLLTQANLVDLIAADLENDLTFVNAKNLEVADLAYASICDTFEEICGLNVRGDLDMNVTGDLAQTAAVIVQGMTNLIASETICFNGGDCTGDTLNDNDFVGEVVATATTVEIVDANGLIVGDITAVDDIFLRSGDNGVGGLTLNGNLTTDAAVGQILLQSDSGVAQSVISLIDTHELILGGDDINESSGDIILAGSNLVDLIAANLRNDLEFVNAQTLMVSDLNYDSSCGTTEGICGLNIGENLILNVTGDITQTAAVIVQGTSNLTATQSICLTGGDCTGDMLNDNDFVGVVTATGSSVEIVDSNALTTGVIIAIDDVFLRSGDNGVGALTLTGNVSTTAANGQVLLQSDSGVTQLGGVVTTSELLLGGSDADERSGNFVLGQSNQVNAIAALLDANLDFVNATSLVVADLNYASDCGTTEAICGLNISGNLVVDVTGNLTQTAAVIVQGTADLIATEIICLTGGDCTVNLQYDNDNDFVGTVTAAAMTVEIVDSNDLLVGDVIAANQIFLRSGESGVPATLNEGTLFLNGNLTTNALTGQILLQSDNGVTQMLTSVITTNELLIGGDVADEGTDGAGINDGFNLVGDNRISRVAASLLNGTLQLNNTQDLTIASSLSYTSCTASFDETIGGLVSRGDGKTLQVDDLTTGPVEGPFADPNVGLANTVQGMNVNPVDPLDPMTSLFNPSSLFDVFLDTADTGIAVLNAGELTTEFGAEVIAEQADIYLETTGINDLNINDSVTVENLTNRILVIAGDDLVLDPVNGRLERGLLSQGLVRDKLNDLILQNPGTISTTFAQVNVSQLNQQLQFIFGTLNEQRFESTIFWGLEGTEDNTFDLPSLNSVQLASLIDLLYNGGNNFESRSFYGFDTAFNGQGAISETVTSQPLFNPFNNSGVTNDSGIATASFSLDFLRTNSVFRNVQFLFNDANINIFEKASTNLVDLNVATADFEGLARIGEPPVLEVNRTVFQIPTRVEITVAPELEFFEAVVVNESPLFVQTVQEKFIVVVYFESQFEADQFEAQFDQLSEESGKETGEKDYELVRTEILEKLNLDSWQWDSGDENNALDVNQVREILEQAGLELGEDEAKEWLEKYKDWVVNRKPGEEPPELPRGIYKIIEVENGKAVIQGDDVDRRFVPEPDDAGDLKDYKFENENKSELAPAKNDGAANGHAILSNRMARWTGMLEANSAPGLVDSSHNLDAGYAAAGSTTVGLLAMLCHRKSKTKGSRDNEMDVLSKMKTESPQRNIFSRSARFKRRNDQARD